MFGALFSGRPGRALRRVDGDGLPHGLSTEERDAVRLALQRHNLRMVWFLAPLAVLASVALALVDRERWMLGSLQVSGVHQMLALAHAAFVASTVLGLRYCLPRWFVPDRPIGRDFAVFVVLFLGSIASMSLLGIVERGSTTLISIALMISNLVFRLPLRALVLFNVLLLVGACVLRWTFGSGFSSLLIGMLELLALSVITLVAGYGLSRQTVLNVLGEFREARRHRKLQDELEIAARVQRALLPRQWPQSPAFAMAGFMEPARNVGGDYYDHFALPGGRLGLIVADVSDKGVAAGLFGMMCKTVTRSAMLTSGSLAEAFEAINAELSADNDECMFVTCVGAAYDPASGRLQMVNAGHVAPLLLKPDGQLRWVLGPRCPALGLRSDRRFHAFDLLLEPGDLLLFMTDGVTEAMSREREAFGAARVEAVLRTLKSHDVSTCLEELTQALAAFGQGVDRSDDITCLALMQRRTGA